MVSCKPKVGDVQPSWVIFKVMVFTNGVVPVFIQDAVSILLVALAPK